MYKQLYCKLSVFIYYLVIFFANHTIFFLIDKRHERNIIFHKNMLGFMCKRAKFISNVHVAHLPILTFRKWVISLSNDSMHVIDRRSEKFPKSF